jgi:UPF0755 protein
VKSSLVATVLVILLAAGLRLAYLMTANVTVIPPVELDVKAGATAGQIAAELEERHVIRDARALAILARLLGRDRDIRHGEHRFAGRIDAADVLHELMRTPTATVRVTIPEGLTWREVASLLDSAGIVSADDYAEAVCDPAFIAAAGAGDEANCSEGYLFPDTYALAPGMTAAAIAGIQLKRFQEVIEELLPSTSLPAPNALLSPSDVAAADFREVADDGPARNALIRNAVVLASIIEKETSRDQERPVISSVFHNRLLRGMLLQADPTVIYGLIVSGAEWDGNLTRKDLREPLPYNTYVSPGLPPGPICNPGRESLRAALHPASTPYLYFVARGDGTHQFSKTLREHNRAVAQYAKR